MPPTGTRWDIRYGWSAFPPRPLVPLKHPDDVAGMSRTTMLGSDHGEADLTDRSRAARERRAWSLAGRRWAVLREGRDPCTGAAPDLRRRARAGPPEGASRR